MPQTSFGRTAASSILAERSGGGGGGVGAGGEGWGAGKPEKH